MSEALRLAHELILAMRDTDAEHWDTLEEAAAELSRLHALNAELVEALQWYVDEDDVLEMEGNEYWLDGRDRALAALAKWEASK